MRQSNLTPMVIFSVDQATAALSDNIRARTSLATELTLAGISYKELLGSYLGQTETSFICSIDHYDFVKQVAKLNQQQSILVIDNERQASLVYVDGTKVAGRNFLKLGTFKAVPRDIARAQDAWTYCHALNTYYITTPRRC